MKPKRSAILLVAAFALLAGAVHADVVTVTPIDSNLCTNGWTIQYYNQGSGRLCAWGPSVAENPGPPFLSGGKGAFYATCDRFTGSSGATGDKTPSTSWLGLEDWTGQTVSGKTLGSITDLNYYSFVSKVPQRWEGGVTSEQEWWSKWTWWRYPNQPIILELTVQTPDGGEVRPLWYRAWGGNYTGDDYPMSHINKWEHLNCLTYGKWYMPQSGTTNNTIERGWTSWNEMMNFQLPDGPLPAFRDWTICSASAGLLGAGWNKNTNPTGGPITNGTGKAINFHVGARITSTGPLFLNGTLRWFNHTYGFRGQVDQFTLGFSGETPVTYDFEPAPGDPDVTTVATTAKALLDPIQTLTGARLHNMYKVTGKVLDLRDATNQYFLVEDGSNLTYYDYYSGASHGPLPAPVWVFQSALESGDVRIGDYISVWGYPEKLLWPNCTTPMILWSSTTHVTNQSSLP